MIIKIDPTLMDGLLAILFVGGETADRWILYQKPHPGLVLSVWVFDDKTAVTTKSEGSREHVILHIWC